ncbi:MAG: AAA family ATPase [Burkholderia sp.]
MLDWLLGINVNWSLARPIYATTPREVVNFAIEHLTERQGIFTKSELLESAYMKALRGVNEIDAEVETAKRDGRLVPELPLYQTAKSFSRDQAAIVVDKQFEKFRHDNDLHKLTRASWVSMLVNVEGYSQERAEKTVDTAIASGRLVQTEERYTTGEMRRSELAVLWMEKLGRETVKPIKTAEEVEKMLAGTDLNEGQRDAAKLVLTTGNRIVGIQGYAGTGKSHMLSKSVEAIKAEAAKQAAGSGYQVIGLAPYGSQNKALKELGMESQTLASFLIKEPAPGALGPKTIIFLDEASVVPVHQMKALMERVERSDSRLVLIGDRKQTQAVEAGKPFEQLQDAGMSLAHVTEIQRQRNAPTLKAAVEKAATGNVPGSVFMLKENTTQIDDSTERYKAIAGEYARLSLEDRNKTLIVVGTNDARREINDLVRANLKLPEGEFVRALETYDMSRAEHRQASSYIKDVVLVSERDGTHGLKRGEQFTVDAVDAPNNTITVIDKDGNRLLIDAAKLEGVSTYRKAEIELVPGDWVRLTRNDNKQQVYNGERHRVQAVEPDAVVLENGARLSREGHIHAQHGYAQTVHSAQGLTSDRVLIDADTKSLTSNRAVYYVAISRPRTDLKIYTDDRSALADTMNREPKKYAALELRDQRRESEILSAASALRQQEKSTRQARAALAQSVSKGPDKGRRQSTAKRGRAR